jgi:hypothetical protein
MPEDTQLASEMESTTPSPATDSPTSESSKQDTFTAEEVANLQKALRAERDARKQYEREVKEKARALERFAEINPDEYTKLQEEASKAAALQAQFGEARDAIEAKYSRAAEEAAKKAEAAERSLAEYQKRYALEKVFMSAGGRTDAADGVSFYDMFSANMGSRFRHEPDGSLTVIDAQGDPLLDKETGKRISPEDYVSSFKVHPVYGTFFQGAKGSGAGLAYGGTDSNGMPVEDLTGLSANELFARAFQ